MSNFYDDFYEEKQNDFNSFNSEIEHFKNVLREEVKQEILYEMEQLRKENLELQKVKKKLDRIKLDYQKQLENEVAQLRKTRQEVRQERFEEILKDVAIPITVYGIDKSLAYKPLCGHCDNRLIHFHSPSGQELTEPCSECGQRFSKWVVVPMERNKISLRGERCWSIYEINHKDWLGESKWDLKLNQIYEGDVNISEKQARDIFYVHKNVFESLEKAQAMCDWLNRELPDNLELAPQNK